MPYNWSYQGGSTGRGNPGGGSSNQNPWEQIQGWLGGIQKPDTSGFKVPIINDQYNAMTRGKAELGGMGMEWGPNTTPAGEIAGQAAGEALGKFAQADVDAQNAWNNTQIDAARAASDIWGRMGSWSGSGSGSEGGGGQGPGGTAFENGPAPGPSSWMADLERQAREKQLLGSLKDPTWQEQAASNEQYGLESSQRALELQKIKEHMTPQQLRAQEALDQQKADERAKQLQAEEDARQARLRQEEWDFQEKYGRPMSPSERARAEAEDRAATAQAHEAERAANTNLTPEQARARDKAEQEQAKKDAEEKAKQDKANRDAEERRKAKEEEERQKRLQAEEDERQRRIRNEQAAWEAAHQREMTAQEKALMESRINAEIAENKARETEARRANELAGMTAEQQAAYQREQQRLSAEDQRNQQIQDYILQWMIEHPNATPAEIKALYDRLNNRPR